jgi:hypothetical protein
MNGRLRAACFAVVAVLAVLVLSSSRASAQAPPFNLAFLPAFPSPADRVEIFISGPSVPCFVFDEPQVSGNSIRIEARSGACVLPPPNPPPRQFQLGPLAAGTYTVTVLVDHSPSTSVQLKVLTPGPFLFLDQSRFLVRVTWEDARVGRGSAFAQPLAEESGYFWFFASGTPEIFVKVLDGRAINGHFWVFLSSITDVGFTAAVSDVGQGCVLEPSPPLPQCPTRTYVNPAGRNQNFVDTSAF